MARLPESAVKRHGSDVIATVLRLVELGSVRIDSNGTGVFAKLSLMHVQDVKRSADGGRKRGGNGIVRRRRAGQTTSSECDGCCCKVSWLAAGWICKCGSDNIEPLADTAVVYDESDVRDALFRGEECDESEGASSSIPSTYGALSCDDNAVTPVKGAAMKVDAAPTTVSRCADVMACVACDDSVESGVSDAVEVTVELFDIAADDSDVVPVRCDEESQFRTPVKGAAPSARVEGAAMKDSGSDGGQLHTPVKGAAPKRRGMAVEIAPDALQKFDRLLSQDARAQHSCNSEQVDMEWCTAAVSLCLDGVGVGANSDKQAQFYATYDALCASLDMPSRSILQQLTLLHAAMKLLEGLPWAQELLVSFKRYALYIYDGS